MLDLLIQNGADVNVLNRKGQTPLHQAVINSCVNNVISLREAGARVTVKDIDGRMAIDYLDDNTSSKKIMYEYLYKHTYKRLPASK